QRVEPARLLHLGRAAGEVDVVALRAVALAGGEVHRELDAVVEHPAARDADGAVGVRLRHLRVARSDLEALQIGSLPGDDVAHRELRVAAVDRSEERRVGKECRSRWSRYE